MAAPNSWTGKYLSGELVVPIADAGREIPPARSKSSARAATI